MGSRTKNSVLRRYYLRAKITIPEIDFFFFIVMKSTSSGPFVKVDSSFVPDDSIFRIEVVKVGKSNHTRFFSIHEKYILLYKVLSTL